MKCESFQKEFFALLDPEQLPEVLRGHTEVCQKCRTLVDFTVRIEQTLPKIKVPPSSAKIQVAFLKKVQEDPNLIRPDSVSTPARDSGRFLKQALLDLPKWKLISGLAASVLVAVGTWWAFREPTPHQPTVVHHRHQLLSNQIQHTVALAKANSAPKRLTIWSDVVSDLRQEVKLVYRVAASDEMNNLSKMFDSAVQNGMISQAELMPTTLSAVERTSLLKDAMAKLQKAEQDTETLSQAAPPQSLEALKRIAQSAKKGHQRLQTLLQQGGA
jgi:hypothetical protein